MKSWQDACIDAERSFPARHPTLDRLRKLSPDWQKSWAGHRSLQLDDLDDWCVANQPRVILELGSGWTTVVLARYCAEFKGRLITVEENEGWRDKSVMPLMQEWCKIEWYMSPSTVENNTTFYRSLPPGLKDIDLLYVDGPAGYGPKAYAAVDAVRLVQAGIRPRNILFDIRHDSVDVFKLVEGYGFHPGISYPSPKPWYLRSCRHHSWFWRK